MPGPLSKKISKIYKEGYKAPGQAYAIAKNMGYQTGGRVPPLLPVVEEALVRGYQEGGLTQSWWDSISEYATDAADVAVNAWGNPLVRTGVHFAGGLTPGVSEALDIAAIGEGAQDVYQGKYLEGLANVGTGLAGLAIPFVSGSTLKSGAAGTKALMRKWGTDDPVVARQLEEQSLKNPKKTPKKTPARTGFGESEKKRDTWDGDRKSDFTESRAFKRDRFNKGGKVSSAVNALYGYREGGIAIDPKNRGKFTAAAKSRGMGVQEFANKVLSAPEGTYTPLMRKRANFARNTKKWG